MNPKEAGRLGGKKRSEKKTRAVRENGKKGGRPRMKRLLVPREVATGRYFPRSNKQTNQT
jgi:hypothetical protein